MNKEEIRKKIINQLPFLRQKYNVKRLGIFDRHYPLVVSLNDEEI